MTCDEAEILLHALIDGELDAGHARDVETHVAACPACAEKLRGVPRHARSVCAGASEGSRPGASAQPHRSGTGGAGGDNLHSAPIMVGIRARVLANLENFFGGFAVGTALSAALAASLVIAVIRNDQNQQIAGDVVSAHLRSLQAGHLTDVETSDQHTVKPWFNGKLDVAPPVIDLTAQGFTLIGGRLDYINGQPVASIVYRRRKHVINLFVAQPLGAAVHGVKDETVQGFNIRHWSEAGLDLWAVSDIDAGELDEFGQKFTAALHAPGPS